MNGSRDMLRFDIYLRHILCRNTIFYRCAPEIDGIRMFESSGIRQRVRCFELYSLHIPPVVCSCFGGNTDFADSGIDIQYIRPNLRSMPCGPNDILSANSNSFGGCSVVFMAIRSCINGHPAHLIGGVQSYGQFTLCASGASFNSFATACIVDVGRRSNAGSAIICCFAHYFSQIGYPTAGVTGRVAALEHNRICLRREAERKDGSKKKKCLFPHGKRVKS